MLKDLFRNRLFIGALAFFVLCVGGSLLYRQHVEREGAEYAAETQDRIRQWNAKQKEQPTAETPVVEQPEQDGTSQDEPDNRKPLSDVIQSEDVKFESDAEFKARMDTYNADMAAAKTARERNEATMRRIEASPYFHLKENLYNFYKAHPDFDINNPTSPELDQKYVDAVYADNAKAQAYNAAREAELEQLRKNEDMSPWIPPQGGNR